MDDIENGNHWIFNENLANSYTVKVVAGDGFSKTFNGADVANNNDYIVANKCDGQPLTGSSAPLRLVVPVLLKRMGSLEAWQLVTLFGLKYLNCRLLRQSPVVGTLL